MQIQQKKMQMLWKPKDLLWIKVYLYLFSFLFPELSKVAMSRRYGDLHLWVNMLAWSDSKLKPFTVAPLGLSQTFVSCVLATHQWVTKWAVFLDGLNFASGNVPVFFVCLFAFVFLTPCTIPDNRVALKCSVYRQVLREPLVHTLIGLNGAVVSCGALCCYFISFFVIAAAT